jgi:hypothetical protein
MFSKIQSTIFLNYTKALMSPFETNDFVDGGFTCLGMDFIVMSRRHTSFALKEESERRKSTMAKQPNPKSRKETKLFKEKPKGKNGYMASLTLEL